MTNIQLGFLRRSAANIPLFGLYYRIDKCKMNDGQFVYEDKLDFVQLFARVKNVEFKWKYKKECYL